MSIQFNVVTWYSKLLSIIFFIAVVPALTFFIGQRYQQTLDITNNQSMLAAMPVVSVVRSTESEDSVSIDIGDGVLEGKTFGFVTEIYEKGGELWVNIDPADQVTMAECVFRAYDEQSSRDCQAPNGTTVWNTSTSTITVPLDSKAMIAVYYNDGTKIDLKPKVINSKNGKLYAFPLSIPNASTTVAASTSPTTATSTESSDGVSTLAQKYNRILSHDGDDTYRWNPLMYLDIKNVDGKSKIYSIEEVWKP
jgi:hypothetical protein